LISASLVMRIRTFTPSIIYSILDDSLPDHLTLFDIEFDPSALWKEQGAMLSLLRTFNVRIHF